MKIKIEDLLEYEMWSICEYIPKGWLQSIVAKLMAYQVNGKLRRYNNRIERKNFIRNTLSKK